MIHEATFLKKEEMDGNDDRRNKHSALPEVMEMAAQLDLKALILGHFSSRYADQEIDTAIKAACDLHGINFPVYRVLPGQLVKDILRQEPIR